jgi:hypothetical protein
MDLPQPQRPPMLILHFLGFVLVARLGGLHDTETLLRSVFVFNGPPEIVRVELPPLVNQVGTSLAFGSDFGLFLLPLGLPPSLPLSRDAVALRSVFTAPRHPGQ